MSYYYWAETARALRSPGWRCSSESGKSPARHSILILFFSFACRLCLILSSVLVFLPFVWFFCFVFFSHFRLFIFVSLPLAWFFSLVSLPLTWFISRFPPFSLNFLPRFPTFSLFFSLSVSPLSLKSVTAFPCDFPSLACYRLLFPLRVHIRQIHV